ARLEHVAQDLSVGLVLGRVALEARGRLRRVFQDLADDLAGLVDGALVAEALLVANRLLGLDVEAHHLGGEAGRDEPGNAADRAFLAVEIEHRDIAFGRAVALDDLRNAEAALELRPDLGTQSVAAGEAQFVRALLRMRRRVEQVTAQLADILEQRAVP